MLLLLYNTYTIKRFPYDGSQAKHAVAADAISLSSPARTAQGLCSFDSPFNTLSATPVELLANDNTKERTPRFSRVPSPAVSSPT